MVAETYYDDNRLQAEAYVKSMETTILDLVMRRQVLAVQIRNLIDERKYQNAEQLLSELRDLPTQEQLAQMLGRQQDQVFDQNSMIQGKIDKLFGDTKGIIFKYIDAQLASDLARELTQAQSGE
jgi:hypothetical protein